MEAKKRESFKVVEINEKKYRIGKFTPLMGSYILIKLEGQGLRSLSKAEIFDIQKDCLKLVSEVISVEGNPDQYAPIMTEDGRLVGEDNDLGDVVSLVTHVLGFNLEGFFEEGASAVSKKKD